MRIGSRPIITFGNAPRATRATGPTENEPVPALRYLSLYVRIQNRKGGRVAAHFAGEHRTMAIFAPLPAAEALVFSRSSSPSYSKRGEPVWKTDHASVGRARGIGWRQVCRRVAARGRRPGSRQDGRWISPS